MPSRCQKLEAKAHLAMRCTRRSQCMHHKARSEGVGVNTMLPGEFEFDSAPAAIRRTELEAAHGSPK